jgi:ABC-type dipeptide/oligopeptide/nickel transport system permease component
VFAFQTILPRIANMAVVILCVGLSGAALMRYAPGFDADEHDLDSRLSAETKSHLREARQQDANLGRFLWNFSRKALYGDWGYSVTLNRPVRELVAERGAVTARELGGGLLGAASGGLALAFLVYSSGSGTLLTMAASMSALLLSVPAGLLGYAALWLRLPSGLVLGAVLLPYLFQYATSLMESMRHRPHLLAARCRGVGPWRIRFAYALAPSLPEWLASLGAAASLGFSLSIPIEYASGTPGLGQLAWQAASSRDFSTLFALTLLSTAFVMFCSTGADMISGAGAN